MGLAKEAALEKRTSHGSADLLAVEWSALSPRPKEDHGSQAEKDHQELSMSTELAHEQTAPESPEFDVPRSPAFGVPE